MKDLPKTVRVAVCQLASVLFDKEKTLAKAVAAMKEAGENGAELVVFPDVFVPAYPRGFSYGYVVGSRTMEGRED